MVFVEASPDLPDMMPHTIEFWELEEPHGTPPSPRATLPRHPQANLYDNSRRITEYAAPPAHQPSIVHHHPHAPPPPYPNMMYGGGGWKPYGGYPHAPAHHGYYYPPVPPESFQPPTSTNLARTSSAAAPPPSRPLPVVTMVNPRFETSELIYDINDHDVLCGRGAPTSWHPGNQFFRLLIDKYQGPYLAAKRMDKPEIAMRVVALVHERGGRFLKRTKVVTTSPHRRSSPPGPGAHGRSSSSSSSSSPLGGSRGHFAWQDIGEQRAYEKACQALREGAPELRKQLAAREAMSASLHSSTSSDAGTVDPPSSHHPHDDPDCRHRLSSSSSPFSSTAAEARNDVESSSDEDGCRSFQE